jgi:molybdopterin molybdotransferase
VLVTGEELVAPGQRPGQKGVFESNGLMLSAALKETGLDTVVQRVGDHPAALARAAKKALAKADVLMVTGGVSVGDHDPTRKALQAAGVKQVFWRVAQKPGGPLYFGRQGKKAVFGLPGNPAAVYSCFQLYVLPLLQKLMGRAVPKPFQVRLKASFRPLRRKTFFVKASLFDPNGAARVRILGGQGSHLLEGMALGDGLLEIPPSEKELKAGALLNFHPFKEGRHEN